MKTGGAKSPTEGLIVAHDLALIAQQEPKKRSILELRGLGKVLAVIALEYRRPMQAQVQHR